ncbi:MAG: PD40 domain-containing protein [Bryobacteraceae bacterium]|nr:PD40 domain-containing protein [Bryobacteraceae bacterium]
MDSWKEIAAYLRHDIRTVQRWEACEGLPVHRHSHSQRSSVYAYTGELDQWWAGRESRPPVHAGSAALPPTAPGSLRRGLRAVLVAAAVIAGAWVTAVYQTPPPPLTTRPLTAADGVETQPDFSPDGTRIAYLWRKPGEPAPDIYVKSLDAGDPVPLTNTPKQWELLPTWSPDGKWIAYFGSRLGGTFLMVIPSSGGPERPVYPKPWNGAGGIAWTPDGSSIITPLAEGSEGLTSLHIVSLATGERHKLIQPPPDHSDAAPALSTDGHKLAFLRIGNFGILRRIHLATLSNDHRLSGEPVPLDLAGGGIETLSWIDGGKRLLYSECCSSSGSTSGFWTVSARGRRIAPRLLFPLPGAQALQGRLSPDGSRLAYWMVQASDTGFWRVPLGPGPGAETPAIELISSTATNLNIDISPDALSLAFASNRSGGLEIWTSNLDGSSPRRITNRPGEKSGTPRWSPDGSRIAFDGSTDGNADIFVTGASGGAPQRLTTHPAIDCNVSWSVDGHWFYFGSNRTGEFQIWKMPSTGGQEIQVTRNGGFGGVESPGGGYFYYSTQFRGGELRRVPAWGGREEILYPAILDVHGLRATPKGVYFLTPCQQCQNLETAHVFRRYRLPSGPVEEVARFRLTVRMGFAVAQNDSFAVINAIRHPANENVNIVLVDSLK